MENETEKTARAHTPGTQVARVCVRVYVNETNFQHNKWKSPLFDAIVRFTLNRWQQSTCHFGRSHPLFRLPSGRVESLPQTNGTTGARARARVCEFGQRYKNHQRHRRHHRPHHCHHEIIQS